MLYQHVIFPKAMGIRYKATVSTTGSQVHSPCDTAGPSSAADQQAHQRDTEPQRHQQMTINAPQPIVDPPLEHCTHVATSETKGNAMVQESLTACREDTSGLACNPPTEVMAAEGSAASAGLAAASCLQEQWHQPAGRYLKAVEQLNAAFEEALQAYEEARQAEGEDHVSQTARIALERQFHAMFACLDGICPRRAASREEMLESLLTDYSEKLISVVKQRM